MNDLPTGREERRAALSSLWERARALDLPYIVAVFTMSRLCIFFVGYLANLRIEKFRYYQKLGHWLDPFFQWDAYWYMAIARDGYQAPSADPLMVNFFPLYPWLVRVLSFFCSDIILSGLIIANVALLAACIFMYHIAMLCCGDRSVARSALAVLLVFPTSFYLSSFYAESLFIATAAGSYCFALQRRWAAASFCALLAGMTRQIGVLLIAPLIIEFVRINWGTWRPDIRDGRQGAWLLLAPCGLVIYMVFLYWQFGDALAFVKSAADWGRHFVMPWETIIISFHRYNLFECIIYAGTLGLIAGAVLLMVAYRLPISGIVFALLMLGVILTMRILESSPRYTLYIFPIYLALGRLVAHHDALRFGLGMFSVLLLGLFTILFVSGYRMY